MLFGREAAATAIECVLQGARTTDGGGLLLRGHRGSGKTSLLDHANSHAKGFRILRCTGSATEEHVPYSALHQLLRPLLGAGVELPKEQARALHRTLGLLSERNADRFDVPLALLDLLSEAARQEPLLLLVDDAHAVDHETASVLAFLGSRLRNENVGLIMAAEILDDYAFAVHGVTTIDLLPLDATGILGILLDVTGERPSWNVVEEVLVASHGNPKAASTLASNLTADQVAGRAMLPEPLPIPASHEAPLLMQLRQLPKATQTLLLIAALDPSGDSMRLFAAAQRLGLSVISALEPAEAVGVIDVAGVAVTFRQPLMREAIMHAASFRDRRAVHLALAALLRQDGEHERALWHCAQATLGPDEQLASDLEATAKILRQSSGCALAVKVLEKAAELSQNASRKAFRHMLASEMAAHAGHGSRALSLAEAARGSMSATSLVRVRSDFASGLVWMRQGNLNAAIETLTKMATDAEQIDSLMSIVGNLFASSGAFLRGDLEKAAMLMRRASGLPPGTEDRIPYEFGFVPGMFGEVAHDAAARVPLLGEAAATAVDRSDTLSLVLATRIAFSYGDRRSATRFAERALRQARDEGAIGLMPDLMMDLASSSRDAERTAVVEADSMEAMRLAEELGQDLVIMRSGVMLGFLTSVQGRREEADAHLGRVLRLSESLGSPFYSAVAKWIVAVGEMTHGSYEQAYDRLCGLHDAAWDVHPLVGLWSTPDLVEAAARSRKSLDTAERLFERYSAWVDRNQSQRALGLREVCRAYLSDGKSSLRNLESALYHFGDARTWLTARTRLAYGEVLRRNRRRNDARVQLRIALDIFETMGAAPWANRARAELRVSGDATRRPLEGVEKQLDMLTPQELQIARLVGSGFSNREVGGQLFLSHRTVEYHLHKIFSKLAVTSRSELVRLVMERVDLADDSTVVDLNADSERSDTTAS
jgi:DNA-binding NarL/FixJ family response regulator